MVIFKQHNPWKEAKFGHMGHHDKWKRWKTTWLNIFYRKKTYKNVSSKREVEGARNIDLSRFWSFLQTKTPERRQNLVTLRNYLTKHISYKREHVKRFWVSDRSKDGRNVNFQSLLAIFTQHDPLKGEKIGHIVRQGTSKGWFFFWLNTLHIKNDIRKGF